MVAYFYYPKFVTLRSKKILIGECQDGYAFRLRVSTNIPDLEAWKAKWEIPGSRILNYYHDIISPEAMEMIITVRWFDGDDCDELDEDDIEIKSHYLIHSKIGFRGCIKQEDSWDLIRNTYRGYS